MNNLDGDYFAVNLLSLLLSLASLAFPMWIYRRENQQQQQQQQHAATEIDLALADKAASTTQP